VCLFNQPKQPSMPKAPPLPPPVAPPPAPALPPPAPQPLQSSQKKAPGIKLKRSKAENSGAVSRGTNQLRIPINIGSNKSGGINLG